MNKLFTLKVVLLSFIFVLSASFTFAKKKKEDKKSETKVESSTFSGLKWRSIGPAFTSGRIADFAVNPDNHAIYYVAAASGHIWKTTNNGTTFKPVFDNYGAYSIGCLAMDPSNSHTVWAGTGENNHQRALGYGNGVYKTNDGGKTWKNMGLKESRQIGEILIDPRCSDVVYVAAEGSAWGPGGDRGLYKTTDGGKTWEKVLEISENTGVANICFEPGNPDVIYAGAEQRRRRQYTKIGGGPESAFYKSKDGGKTWDKLTNGIPGVDKGGMEIVVSPANPDIIYVMFEASNGKGGVYRSTDRGGSFSKMNDYNSSGQYYTELICDPIDQDKVFSVDTYSKYTTDGGKSWKSIGNNKRHVDDHAIWIDPEQTTHMFIGGDGGVYETFDGGKTYFFKGNLPVTQFYRVNVDNTEPFYWVYGGTQDNNSLGGPSQNINRGGVTSDELVVTLGGDGFWQASEPSNPDIVYSAYQYGNIYRYDRKSGERIKVKPVPQKDELTFRWNWDAPFILSKYNETTLYIAANKLFKSTDRGNSWTAISGDLTRDEDRNQFKVMGKYWPASAVAKDVSTSQWGTIVSLAESPLKEGLLYVGTDDGVIQISEDDGENWSKITSFPNIPEYTYVSDICPSSYDENVVFATFNNTKSDDFKPYVLKSNDKGKTWTSIANNLPENGSVHSILQDPVNKNLLFIGTEFSFYFSLDGGQEWTKFAAGLPDVAVRDIVIQEREMDLVIATFGRGFYILDNYSPLRELSAEKLKNEDAILFPVKDALMYVQEGSRYGTGSAIYIAKNPEFGATFTYFIKEVPKSLKSKRLKKEKELFKNGEPIPQPTKEILDKEAAERGPWLKFDIKNSAGDVVRTFYKKASKGIHRTNWDLRYQSPGAVNLRNDEFNPTRNAGSSFRALPGKYTVEMSIFHNGELKQLAGPVEFEAKVLNNTTLPAKDRVALDNFYTKVIDLWRVTSGTQKYFESLKTKSAYIQQALQQSPKANVELINKADEITKELKDIDFLFDGTPAKASWEEVPPEKMPLSNRFENIAYVSWQSTSEPTKTQLENYKIMMEEFPPALEKLKEIDSKLKMLETELDKIKAPHTPGRVPKF
ncbi:MAG: glycosyl hydrolase [Marinilabiliales bacterium]|nr:MAG: glycosyl hydrolase [Marinilabiliales bacterium]